MLISSVFVFGIVNPVQSLLWLVCVFICASLLLLEMGAEFIAVLLILVYIGAIAVLFLFVIMLLNIRLIELNWYFINYKFISVLFSLGFLLQIFFLFYYKDIDNIFINNLVVNYFWISNIDYTSNIEVIGILLFKIFYYYFFFLSLILLVALLGTLILLVPIKT
jgi:NADH-quinone oxidoreductase subunit J